MKRMAAGLFLLSLILGPLACKDGAPEGSPPSVPAEATFVADFSSFDNSASPVAAQQGAPLSPTAGTNWLYSALVVGFWNTALTVTLVPPVAAFRAAVNLTPVGENGAWVWRYNFTAAAASYSARLEARPVTAGINWDMYITKAGDFTDFHWYTGVSRLDGTSGTWSLQKRPAEPAAFLDITWNRNVGAGTGDIRYTNAVNGSVDKGSYILHEIAVGTTYDAHAELGNVAASNVTRIEWNRASKAGRVRDQAHFGDALWHCWDGSLNNLAC